jgi:hypothetical protein
MPYEESMVPEALSGSVSSSGSDEQSSGTDLKGNYGTELQERYLAVVDVVDRLYKLSIVIQSPSLRNKFLKAATYVEWDEENGVNLSSEFEHFAMTQVKRLCPNAPEESGFLLERLGKAISQRRRQFMYRRTHRLKLVNVELSTGPHQAAGPQNKEESPKSCLSHGDHASFVQSSMVGLPKHTPSRIAPTFLSQTTATRYDPGVTPSADTRSTVSTSTFRSAQNSEICVPPAPGKVKADKPFECPYCYMIVPAKTSPAKAWK